VVAYVLGRSPSVRVDEALLPVVGVEEAGDPRAAARALDSAPARAAVEETIKRRVQPYFVLDGNICALLAAKDHVNVFLYDGGIVPDPDGIITAGHDNKAARTIAFREGERSTSPRSRRYSDRSSPTTGPAVGERSRPPPATRELGSA
jgi:hypothetical protein